MRTLIEKIIFTFFMTTAIAQGNNHIAYPCSAKDKQAITSAINYELDHGSSAIPSSHVKIMHEQCIKHFASAIIHPKKNETDNALVYLQKVNDKWKVLTLGTDFGDSLDKLHIPKELQEATTLHNLAP